MQLLKKIGITVLLLCAVSAQAEITHIDNDKMAKLLAQGVPLIDVRTQSEWKETGIVEGSHLLTLFDEKGRFDIDKWLAELDKIAGKDQPFMLICAVGGRTGMLSQYLDRREGYSQVHNVQWGIQRWIGANKPIANYPLAQ